MKRIIRTEQINKTFIITDDGEELLIDIIKQNDRKTEYLTLVGSEKKDSLTIWRDLDKVLRAKLKSEKEVRENSKTKQA